MSQAARQEWGGFHAAAICTARLFPRALKTCQEVTKARQFQVHSPVSSKHNSSRRWGLSGAMGCKVSGLSPKPTEEGDRGVQRRAAEG